MKTTLSKHFDPLIFAFAGFLIIYFLTHQLGIGVSPDSVVYLSVARSINHGEGFYTFSNTPLISFPVFYPLFLAGVSFIAQNDVLSIAPILNALEFAIVIYFSGLILGEESYLPRYLKFIALSCIIFCAPFIEVFGMLWSETLFILLSLFIVLLTYQYLKNTSSKILGLLGFTTALLCITRFAGVTVLCSVSLLIIVYQKVNWKKKWKQLLIFNLLGISFLVFNLIRNYLLKGNFTGERQSQLTSIDTHFKYLVSVFLNWLNLHSNNLLWIVILSFILGLMGLFQLFKRWLKNDSLSTMEDVVAIFFIVYILFMLIIASLSKFEELDNRLLSPIFIYFIFIIVFKLKSFMKTSFYQRNKSFLAALLILIFTVYQVFQVKRLVQFYQDSINYGLAESYNQPQWKHLPIINYIQFNQKHLKENTTICSNANDAVYYFAGIACKALPEKAYHDDVKRFYKEHNKIIVDFRNEFENEEILKLEEIEKFRKCDTLYIGKDGLILYTK